MTSNPTYQTATFSLGAFSCTVINDGMGSWQMKDAFPSVPKDVFDKAMKTGSYKTETPRQGNVLFIDTGKQKVLIDAGNPTASGAKLLPTLNHMGISGSDIDVLLITHGDGDHIGGLDNYDKADIIMPKKAYQLWTKNVTLMTDEFLGLFGDSMDDATRQARTDSRLGFAKTVKQLGNRIRQVDFEEEVISGFRFVDGYGHRSDHAAVEIESDGAYLLHVVDSFRHPIQVHNPFTSLFDSYRAPALETMQRLMHRAADKNALIFGAHILFPSIVRITHGEDGLEWHDIGGGF